MSDTGNMTCERNYQCIQPQSLPISRMLQALQEHTAIMGNCREECEDHFYILLKKIIGRRDKCNISFNRIRKAPLAMATFFFPTQCVSVYAAVVGMQPNQIVLTCQPPGGQDLKKERIFEQRNQQNGFPIIFHSSLFKVLSVR